MSKLKKTFIFIAVISLLGYILSFNPNGQFFVPVAKLIKKKGEVEDSRVHSLDLEKHRPKKNLSIH